MVTLQEIIDNPKMVIRTITENQAVRLLSELHQRGLCWVTGRAYSENTSWHLYESDTCYLPNGGEYSECSWFKQQGYIIVPYSEIQEFQNHDITYEEALSFLAKGKTDFFAMAIDKLEEAISKANQYDALKESVDKPTD